ncbi:hypothetical protein FN846DRAFT_893277 [Sphaerosporella brunnea]|uniref:Uncharacterized protein n=1 Tax=Sphaerosporella brunnea TaxID=1250544 RepID=A0A5J5EMJ6_9PEZI|nr:hypothetical protein FN846DRAFT_893277 [Sphaerosporella brunnea]
MSPVFVSSGSCIHQRLGRAAAPSPADQQDDAAHVIHQDIIRQWRKNRVDAVECSDSDTEADTRSDVEGTAGDGTEIHSDHGAPEGTHPAAEAVLNSSPGFWTSQSDLYRYQTNIPCTSEFSPRASMTLCSDLRVKQLNGSGRLASITTLTSELKDWCG